MLTHQGRGLCYPHFSGGQFEPRDGHNALLRSDALQLAPLLDMRLRKCLVQEAHTLRRNSKSVEIVFPLAGCPGEEYFLQRAVRLVQMT